MKFEDFQPLVQYWTTVGVTALQLCGHPECAATALEEEISKKWPEAPAEMVGGLTAMVMAFTMVGVPDAIVQILEKVQNPHPNQNGGYL